MRVRAGELDRKVTLRSPDVETRNEWNEPIQSPGESYEVRAQYLPVSDAEKFAAAEIIATLTARFVVRWAEALKDMNSRWTIIFEGREFDCLGVKELGRQRRGAHP